MIRTYSSGLGFIFIFVGTIIVVSSLGSLLMRALIALVGIALINIGFKLQGSVPLHYRLYSWFNRSRF